MQIKSIQKEYDVKNLKYTYQELPPQKTQPPHTAKKKRGRAWFIK
jgi:hypothetical protein